MDLDLLMWNKKGEIFENQEGSLIFVCCICNEVNSGLEGVEAHLKTHIPIFIKVEENLDLVDLNELQSELRPVNNELISDEPFKDWPHFKTDLIPDGQIQVIDTFNKRPQPPKPPPKRKIIPKTPITFECEQCGRTFTHKYKLRVHIWTHLEDKPLKCHICGNGFAQMDSLRVHVRRHEKIKPYKCPQCPKAFCSFDDRRIHIRSHTGDRNYVCSTCGIGFKTASNLSKHIRYVHKKERKHVCEYNGCGMRYFNKHELTVHIRTHTGERPLTSAVCGKTFANPKSLYKHLKSLHCQKLNK